MIEVTLKENQIEEMFKAKLEERLNEIESRTVYWDMKELCRQTCMSAPVIKEQFFYDERFQKFRVGKKWFFPAKQTEEFLLQWLSEQSTY